VNLEICIQFYIKIDISFNKCQGQVTHSRTGSIDGNTPADIRWRIHYNSHLNWVYMW